MRSPREQQPKKTGRTLFPGVAAEVLYRGAGITLYLITRPSTPYYSLVYLDYKTRLQNSSSGQAQKKPDRQLYFSVTKSESPQSVGVIEACGYKMQVTG